MKRKNLGVKITIVLLAILYFIIGLADIIQGADPTSKFFAYDNIIVRVLGCLFIISSIGILLKKGYAYKLLVITALLSIGEGILTFDTMNISILDTFSFIFVIFIIYLPPVIGFSSKRVKRYFNIMDNKEDLVEDINEEEKIKLPQSKLGVASFVLSLVGVILFLIAVVLMLKMGNGETGLDLSNVEIIIFVFLFINMLTSFAGLGLGVAGTIIKKRKKIYSIIGLALNLIMSVFYIAVIVVSISFIKDGQYQLEQFNFTNEYTHQEILYKDKV